MTSRQLKTLALAAISLLLTVPAIGQTAKPASIDAMTKARLLEVYASPRLLESSVKSGAKVATFCANCHGDGGNSVKSDVPNLAGQSAAYLLGQMVRYLDGRKHTTEFHRRLVKVLSAEEKFNLVVFYARQEVTYKAPSDMAMFNRGKQIYKDKCSECHEDDGQGDEYTATVAGQQPAYMSGVLKSYRDDPASLGTKAMIKSVKGMSDPDMSALVAYITSMK